MDAVILLKREVICKKIDFSTTTNRTLKTRLQKENTMKKQKTVKIGTAVIVIMLLSSAGGLAFAGDNTPLTPELAAKREMVRKQQVQRITPEMRKAAAEALKAERLKIYKAKQATQHSVPAITDSK